MKHPRPNMRNLPLAQQSRSFNGYVSQLRRQMQCMLRTAETQGYTSDQLEEFRRRRAATLHAFANEIENLQW